MTAATLSRPVAPQDHLSRPDYRPDIDGLRAIAVLSVVGYHAFPDAVRGGFIGVDIFFVISGYLISSIILRSLERGEFTLRAFYAARVRRIFPALITVLLACFAAGWFTMVAEDFQLLGKHIVAGTAFASNLVLWSEAGYFAEASELKPLLHLWSLGIEEQFYLAWPLLLVFARKRHLSWIAAIVLVIVASFAHDVITVRTDAVASFYSPLARVWELMIGGVLAWISLHHAGLLERFRDARAVAGLLLIAAALALINRRTPFPGWWALLPTLGAFLLISAGPQAWINRHALALRPMVWIGLVSYPLYLWHWPVLTYARIVSLGVPTRNVRAAAVAGCLVLAWLTYIAIERPLRTRGNSRKKAGILCGVMALVFAVGGVTYLSRGFPARTANLDPRARFLQYYEDMQEDGLKDAYRSGCDFYNWKTAQKKASIDAECTRPGEAGTYFLWGDSHAQALSLGIVEILPQGVRLAQVATAGCKPSLRDSERITPGDACNVSNRFAIEAVKKLRPQVVILTQLDKRPETDWEEIADFIHAAGGGSVIVMGPLPQWRPSLPLIIAKEYWDKPHERVSIGLQTQIFEEDRRMKEKYGQSTKLRYVSITDHACNAQGCLATVPGDRDEHNLMAADYGHLTPRGSEYVVRELLRDELRAKP